MGNSGKIVLALLAGVAAGVAIGIMLAPEKGSDTRQNVKDKAKKLADSLIATAEEVIDEMNNVKSKI
ncbi:MAG TPA: YtxH domain-containing protein [Bacteroidia bacterium]|nr:YtxH domain-containing protein [Bacteroidia bacterium]